jgi:ribosomal protein S18 acetylase RimI-like enzyme
MQLQSKALRTDIVMDSLGSKIDNRADCVVIRTPSVADHGPDNRIIFPHAPETTQAFQQMVDQYRQDFDVEAQGFMHITWDQQPSDYQLPPLEDDRWTAQTVVTLAADTLTKPNQYQDQLPIRTIEWNHDLPSFVDLHVDPQRQDVDVAWQRKYWQMKGLKLQQFQEIFEGQRWVVSEGSTLVADVGLYAIKDMARFHALVVDPSKQGQGWARTMLYNAFAHAKQHWHVHECLLVTDANAQALYEKIGFGRIEQRIDLTWVAG